MTGTSLDGLDVALVEVSGHGLELRARYVAGHSLELGEVGEGLAILAEGGAMTASQITRLQLDFAKVHVRALRELLDLRKSEKPDLIAIHGQTLYHAPPLSWQMLQPAPIVAALGVPVVYDLRAADLAAGGQGAPITPLADALLFSAREVTRVIVNLGGFCNITILPPKRSGMQLDRISGCDVCSCNLWLNGWYRMFYRGAYDRDGREASMGKVQSGLEKNMLERLQAQRWMKHSLGNDDHAMLEYKSLLVERVEPADVLASAVSALARCIAAGVKESVPGAFEIHVAGGGAHHRPLLEALGRHTGGEIRQLDDLGCPGTYREAVAMAVLGALCADRVPITLPQITGCPVPAPLAGVWSYPA